MQELAIKDLTENFFEAIGKEWMLVTSGSKEKFNTMTASWGGIGFLWNKAVAFIFIRPERYTYEFIEKNDMLTLSFLGSGNRSIYNICGSKSGRDTDKIKESGLLPLTTPDGNVTFEQARLTLECRKLYGQLLSPEHFIDKSLPDKWYGAQGNFHKVYVVEILKVWEKAVQYSHSRIRKVYKASVSPNRHIPIRSDTLQTLRIL